MINYKARKMDIRLIKAVQLMSMIGRENLSEEQQWIAIRGYFDFLEQVSTDATAEEKDQQLAREILKQVRQYSLMHTAEAAPTSADLAKNTEDPAVGAGASPPRGSPASAKQ